MHMRYLNKKAPYSEEGKRKGHHIVTTFSVADERPSWNVVREDLRTADEEKGTDQQAWLHS